MPMSTRISKRPWGTFGAEPVFLFTLKNGSGSYVEVSNYGATLVNVVVPDRNAKLGSVILGFSNLEGYLDDSCYIGSTIGRYANRINQARFHLQGKTYKLKANDGVNSNHSGPSGFNCKIYGFEPSDSSLVLVLHSKDGDGGFPGNLTLRVTYTWSDEQELAIHYQAVSDQDTYVNLTNHAYFNLSNGELSIADHELRIIAGQILAASTDHIPTGEILPADTAAFKGDNFKQGNQRIKSVNSYYILNKDSAEGFAAQLSAASSGRTLTVRTSYPGIFLYTGDYLSSQHLNHSGRTCRPFEGLCLECQHYPDSMNQTKFPSALLPKHHVYNESIHFKFGLL